MCSALAKLRKFVSRRIFFKQESIGGLSQTGKTQICFQLCMNVQLPKELGGVDGEALYVDTHGDFAVERITEMAKSLR